MQRLALDAKSMTYQDLLISNDINVVEPDNKSALFYRRGVLVGKAEFAAGRYAQLGDFRHYDRSGNTVMLDSYHMNGFLARRQYATQSGEVYEVAFFNSNREKIISVEKIENQLIWINEETGRSFQSEILMFKQFVDDFISKEDTLIIADSLESVWH
jgi:hypothetical protein